MHERSQALVDEQPGTNDATFLLSE